MTNILTKFLKSLAKYLGLLPWYYRWKAIEQYKLSNKIKNNVGTRSDACPGYSNYYGMYFFRGSDREIGQQFAKSTISEKELNRAKQFLENLDSNTLAKFKSTIDVNLDILSKSIPFVRKVMEGMVDVLPKQYDIYTLALLNMSPMLVDWKLYQSCSAIGFKENGSCILGQNQDIGLVEHSAPAFIVRDEGPSMLVHVNPGTVWFGPGVNENGFAYGGASVSVDNQEHKSEPIGIGTTFCGVFLTSQVNNVNEAKQLLRNNHYPWLPMHDGANLILMDKQGDMCRVEMTQNIYCESDQNQLDNFYVSTNHFQYTEMTPLNLLNNKVYQLMYQNSKARELAAKKLTTKCLDVQSLRKLLRAQRGKGAWCRSGKPPDIGWTAASYIVDFNRGIFESWNGMSFKNPRHKLFELSYLFKGQLPINLSF